MHSVWFVDALMVRLLHTGSASQMLPLPSSLALSHLSVLSLLPSLSLCLSPSLPPGSCGQEHPSRWERALQSGRLWSPARATEGRLNLPLADEHPLSCSLDAAWGRHRSCILHRLGRLELWHFAVGDVQPGKAAVWQVQQPWMCH